VDLCTPIMVACDHQQLLCVQALLPHADLAHCNTSGGSLLHVAAAQGDPAVLEAGSASLHRGRLGRHSIGTICWRYYKCRSHAAHGRLLICKLCGCEDTAEGGCLSARK
jgi:hypothetical protein